jgi:hypothetical protein
VGDHRQPAWLTYLAVRDVDAAKQRALQHGAKILFEPHTFPDRGREAVFADPQGAVFAVLASSSGDPPDLLADPGDWIWSALITTDSDTDAAAVDFVAVETAVAAVPHPPFRRSGVLAAARTAVVDGAAVGITDA